MYIKRKMEDDILKFINDPEIIALVGPRQCGKTTLLKKIAEKLPKSVFISFDDVGILRMFEQETDSFIKLYVQNVGYLFIDEFQYSRDGGRILKMIYDNHKTKIFISGSSNIDLTVNAVKFLVGRIIVFNLLPFDFYEFLLARDKKYAGLLPSTSKLFSNHPHQTGENIHKKFIEFFDEYLLYGGYPRVVLVDDFAKKKEILKNIYNTYFLREVKDILGLVENHKLDKLIRLLSLQIGSLVNYQELSLSAEYDYATLKKYLSFLEKTYICGIARPYYKNKRLEVVKNPKFYFIDTGLRNVIADDFRAMEMRTDSGALLENGVYMQIKKKTGKLNYWRDKQKNEVDFIWHLGDNRLVAVEVKNKVRDESLLKDKNYRAFSRLHGDVVYYIAYRKIANSVDEKGGNILPVYFL